MSAARARRERAAAGQHLDRGYLDEIRAWSDQQATDPCAARGHACRCPLPDIDAFVARLNAEHHDQAETFRALFTRPIPPAYRERLAELDALTDRIDPIIQHLDDTWRQLERELGWRKRR